MSFGQAIKTCFSKYFVISGRAPRSEYWWFSLFLFLIGGTLGIIALIAGGSAVISLFTSEANAADDVIGLLAGAGIALLLAFIFFAAVIAPSITVLVRRFHDVGLSGWWIGGYWIANVAVGFIGIASLGMNSSEAVLGIANVLGLILNLASIGIFIVTLLPSQAGANKYGPNPLGGPSDFSTPPPPPGEYKQL